jgi:hypothetical protein
VDAGICKSFALQNFAERKLCKYIRAAGPKKKNGKSSHAETERKQSAWLKKIFIFSFFSVTIPKSFPCGYTVLGGFNVVFFGISIESKKKNDPVDISKKICFYF